MVSRVLSEILRALEEELEGTNVRVEASHGTKHFKARLVAPSGDSRTLIISARNRSGDYKKALDWVRQDARKALKGMRI